MTKYQKTPFLKKDRFALYLSYATLVSSVAIVEAMLFQLPCRHILGQFWQKMKILECLTDPV